MSGDGWPGGNVCRYQERGYVCRLQGSGNICIMHNGIAAELACSVMSEVEVSKSAKVITGVGSVYVKFEVGSGLNVSEQ